jgi:catechol 2,3-dioxygenase
MSQRIQFPASASTEAEPADPGSYGIAPPGHRLPAGTRIGAVRLQVADLGRSLAWYEGILGFRILAQTATLATLGAAGATLPLIELNRHPGALPVPRRGRLGLFHFAILLPERAELGRFLAHLTEAGAAGGAADHLVSEALYLHDPDGLGIEVYADRPPASWRRHGRELAITTEPLDAQAVGAAGGGLPWTGMPAGTTIGHVHLHVGDLERAAEFYHAALGLDAMVWNYPGALFLAAGGYHHHLGLNTWAGPDAEPPRPGDARLLEWELVVSGSEDVDAAARGIEAPGHAVKRDSEGLSVADPWGTALRLRSGGPA